jgi:molybdate transport system substrate-binding protein
VNRRGLLAVTLLLALCGRPSQALASEATELVVFAAASLRDVFETLAAAFEKRHAGVKVQFSFAGSQELRTQIEHGAKPDVFASADQRHMAILQGVGLVRTPVIFTKNRPVVVVPATRPAALSTFADLPKATALVVGASEVPIGGYADAILARAEKSLGKAFRDQVLAHIRSRELNARQVLTKVALGEADAGIVYQSDAQSAKDRVVAIAIPDDINVIATYPVAALTMAPHRQLAKAWIDFLLARPAQDVLAAAGFLPATVTDGK